MTITLTREEAQHVLDALICSGPHGWSPNLVNQHNKALKTLRARLSAPEPEPYGYFKYDLRLDAWVQNRVSNNGVAFYTTPPQREWQGLTDEEMSAAMDYWSDPVRSAYGGAHSADGEYVGMIDTWQYIEAKLKEKNT
jgi:hypothetical protein